jgi:hypothetical protein
MPAIEKSGVIVNVLDMPYVFLPDGTAVKGDIVTIEYHSNTEGNFNGVNPYKK